MYAGKSTPHGDDFAVLIDGEPSRRTRSRQEGDDSAVHTETGVQGAVRVVADDCQVLATAGTTGIARLNDLVVALKSGGQRDGVTADLGHGDAGAVETGVEAAIVVEANREHLDTEGGEAEDAARDDLVALL